MSLLQLCILALIQGVTEFLPISSSGHLILIPTLTGWSDQGYIMDVAVHVGTLFAVMLYFKQDMKGIFLATVGHLGIARAQQAIEGTPYHKLFWALIIATIPVVIVGGIFAATGFIDNLRTPQTIATTSIVFGLLLLWADRKGASEKTLDNMAVKPALIFGMAQILSLIPGTSRSGITLTAGRYLGFTRPEAARFSMLMSIPTIIAAGTLSAVQAITNQAPLPWTDMLIAASLAFLSALMAIHFLMKWLARTDTSIFVYYRVALGVGLFMLIWAGIL